MVIAIDFDGTCVTHEFPQVGKDIGAAEVLRKLIRKGHRLVLFTMRCDTEQNTYLKDAVRWFKHNGIPLWGIQSNPTQRTWTCSPKAYAELYIDDAALGAPLRTELTFSKRPFVDWIAVEAFLIQKGIL